MSAEQRELYESGDGSAAAGLRVVHRLATTARLLDARLLSLQREGLVPAHAASTGEEICAVSAVSALAASDWIVPGLRPLPFLLARGMEPDEVMHRAAGTAADPGRGRGVGSFAGWRDGRLLSVSPSLGTWIVQATGFAWGARLAGDDLVVLAAFGDGCLAQQDLHTGLNFAGVYRAPVVFLWQSRGEPDSPPAGTGEREGEGLPSVEALASSYGIACQEADGTDPIDVRRAVREAASSARQGQGPTLVRADVPREVDAESDDDPLGLLRKRLEAEGAWSEEAEEEMRTSLAERLEEAEAAVRSAERPQAGDVFEDVYLEVPRHLVAQRRELAETTPES